MNILIYVRTSWITFLQKKYLFINYNNMENIKFELTKKTYRSNINCTITVTDRDNNEILFSWQFYVDLDWLDNDDLDEIKEDIDKLEKYCNDNNKNWIQDIMSNIFTWDCIVFDHINLAD